MKMRLLLLALLLCLMQPWAYSQDLLPGEAPCTQVFKVDRLPLSLVGSWNFTRVNRPEWRCVKTPGPWKKIYDDGINFREAVYQTTLEVTPALQGKRVRLLVDAYTSRFRVLLDGQVLYQRVGGRTDENYDAITPIPIEFTLSQPSHQLRLEINSLLMTGPYQLPFEIRDAVPHDMGLILIRFWGGPMRLITAMMILGAGLFFTLVYAKTRMRYPFYLVTSLACYALFPFYALPANLLIGLIDPDRLLVLHYTGIFTVWFHFIFAQYYYQPLKKLTIALGVIYLLLTLPFFYLGLVHFDLDLFQRVRVIYFAYTLVVTLGIVVVALLGLLVKKRKEAWVLVLGAITFVAAAAHDIFLALGFIQSTGMISSAGIIMTTLMLYAASSRFAEAFIHLEDKVEERTAALATKTKEVQGMLDSLSEGLLTFGRDFLVNPSYSSSCRAFFRGEIDGKDIVSLLEKTPEGQKQIKDLLHLYFEQNTDFDLCVELMPTELQLFGRILTLSYLPMEQEGSKQIMLMLTDVTKERALTQQIKEDAARNLIIIKVALDRDGFILFLSEVDDLLLQIEGQLKGPLSKVQINDLFRFYHTLKGGVSAWGFKELGQEVHQLEEELANLRSGKMHLTPELAQELLQRTHLWQEHWNSALDNLNEIIPAEERKKSEKVFYLRESKLTLLQQRVWNRLFKEPVDRLFESLQLAEQHKVSLLSFLAEQAKADSEAAFAEVKKQPIAPVLRKYANQAEDLAGRLGKQVQVEIKGQDLEVESEKLGPLFSTLVHLIRNAIDHGLEEGAERVMLGKSEIGKITIQAQSDHEDLTLEITDDGGGIDPQRVGQKAQEKGLIPEINGRSNQELINLIFAPGFSTNDQVTDTSGRGVGMDAVKAKVDRLGGQIQVLSQVGEGTRFLIRIPKVV